MKKTHDLNMNREYRDELRTLKKHRRKVGSDWMAFYRGNRRAVVKLERELKRGLRAFDKTMKAIDRRAAILEGRLS